MRSATLISAQMLSSNVRALTFEAGAGFTWKPGQWVNFFLPLHAEPSARISPLPHDERGAPLKRPYSIASAPRGDGRFEIAVTLVEGGPASTFLHAIEAGTSVTISEPQGFFLLEERVRPVLMIGTGTGVAPFRAMLQNLAADVARDAVNSAPPIALLFGVRTEADILYRGEFETLARSFPAFRFCPTLSRASDAWRGKRGHVQTHLADLLSGLPPSSPSANDSPGPDIDAYVCGLTKMVHEVRTLLRESFGVERKRVHIERYD
ncbi:MAG: FAD-binding oxidoreductase [Polyangiales bacterium]